MSDVCARGCRYPGRHIPSCPDVPAVLQLIVNDPTRCRGCLPVLAARGAMICDRCIQRLTTTLQDAPDLCAHLRSLVDPMRAQVFDQEKPGRNGVSIAQAPVNVDLIDAEADVFEILSWWASFFGDSTQYAESLPSTATPEDVYSVTKWASDYVLLNMERVRNDSWVVMFSRKVIDWPDDRESWTICKALAKFPLFMPAHWAKRPCPACHLRTVRVTPPRREPHVVSFECRSCGWVPPAGHLDSWAQYLEGMPV